jgi:hypothetical protein
MPSCRSFASGPALLILIFTTLFPGTAGASTAARAMSPTGPAATVPTEAQVYAKVERALRRRSSIYAATVDLRGAGTNARIVQWIDARHNVVRRAVQGGPPPHATYILTAHGTYVHISNIHSTRVLPPTPWARTTPGLLAAHEALLFEPGGTAEMKAPTSVRTGRLGGKSVLVLTRRGRTTIGTGVNDYVHQLYVDAHTYLPVLQVYMTRTAARGGQAPGLWQVGRTAYQHHFVPRSSLPRNFFSPASL